MPILVVGLSHKTAPIEIREQLAFAPHQWGEVAEKLEQYQEIQEKVILSTCNRVEMYARVEDVHLGKERIIQFLCDYHGLPLRALSSYLYSYSESEAVRHLFRVASSLDSMVVGETQILGQVKEAYSLAKAYGMVGGILNQLFEKSFSVAKRVRTETRIAENAVSISSTAVELAKKIFVDLQERVAMLIGAGEMAELAAQHLLQNGVKALLVCNRTFERAVSMAERLHGDAIRYEHLFTYLETVDIVISSTAAPHPILKKSDLQEVIRRRRQKPMFLIDIAVPRDIEPEVNEISNIYLYDIDDLQNVVEANIRERQREAVIAEEIIKREVAAFQRWLEELNVVPTIVSLREKAEAIRKQEMAKALRKLHNLSEEERATIDALTASIVKKLLHSPIVNLKKEADTVEGSKFLLSIRHLFDLDTRLNRPIRVGSRGSLLALQQTDWILRQLASFFPQVSLQKVLIKTIGDLTQTSNVPLAKVGDKGIFIKEIEEALLQEKIDLAVHSIKDLPSQLPPGLIIGAITEREDPRDVLVSRTGLPLDKLPKGARIGTSSLRRHAQLLHYRPDLVVLPIRGNIDTRLRKLATGEYDAIVLAAAGLVRMNWEEKITEYLDPDLFLPAVGQGALGVEIREEDLEMETFVSRLHSEETGAAICAERAFLHRLEGGCQVPVGAWGQIEAGQLILRGMISSVDGKRFLIRKRAGSIAEAAGIGKALAEDLLGAGGQEILDEIYRQEREKK